MTRSYIQKRKNNIIIGTLCAVVLLMSVGYAVFNTMLDITGTSSIKSTWNIHFDESRTTEAITTKVGLSGAEAPTGTVTYPDSLTANLTATLIQPGDEVTYNLVVKNDGDLPAQLISIEVSDSDNENIIFTNSTQAGFSTDETNLIKVGETLESKASKNIVIRVAYRDATINKAEQSTSNLTVKLNFAQDGEAGVIPPNNQVVYRWTRDTLNIGDSIEGIETTTDPTQTYGRNHYLKHEIDSENKIVSSEVCFITDTEHCMKPNDNQNNKNLIQSQESWFNNGGGCKSYNSSVTCSIYTYEGEYFTVYDNGGVRAGYGRQTTGGYEARCNVNSDGSSLCEDFVY